MSDTEPGTANRAPALCLTGRGRVTADLSRPESTNRLAVPFASCDHVPDIGAVVTAVDYDHALAALADVVGIDEQAQVIRIAVDWTSLMAVRVDAAVDKQTGAIRLSANWTSARRTEA